MRIGIFGGTFNPPHLGHKKLALEMKKAAGFDKIIIIPTCEPPHKKGNDLASSDDRLEMCRLEFSEDFFSVSDIEIRRKGKSYTFDTVTELRKEYPDDELFLIVGSDMLLSFDRWYRYRDILTMVSLAVATREGEISFEALKDYAQTTLGLSSEKGEIVIADVIPFECSSTLVREKIRVEGNADAFVSDEVASYIKSRGLYSDKYAEYKAILREKLDDYRYTHSLGVADSALELAGIYGGDKEKAYFAGLVHDIMKNTPFSEQLQIMEKGGIILSQAEKNNKALWHAMSGAVYLRDVLGVKDEEILGAVRYHTTGKNGMTLLEKIIYIADYISAERNYPDVEVMRNLSKNVSLEAASLYALKFSFEKFSRENRIIHTDSVDYYNELIIDTKGMNEND